MAGARTNTDATAALDGALDRDREEMRSDLKEAYERGRKDERASRRRHPLLMSLTVVAAVVGVITLALAAVNGSFESGGGVIDQNLQVAVNRAQPKVHDAAVQAGQSLRDAGQAPKPKAAAAAG